MLPDLFYFRIRLIGLIMVALYFLSIINPAYAAPQSNLPHINVLLLYSWDKDLPWQKAIEKGFKQKLAAKNISLDIFSEYIDAGRFPMNRIKASIYELFKKKYVDIVLQLWFGAAQIMLVF